MVFYSILSYSILQTNKNKTTKLTVNLVDTTLNLDLGEQLVVDIGNICGIVKLKI